MIVDVIHTENAATIIVHDDAYKDKTKEENEQIIKEYSQYIISCLRKKAIETYELKKVDLSKKE